MNWKTIAQQQIDEWKAKIDHLRVRLNLLQKDVKDEYDERLTLLHRRWQEVETDLERWGDNAEARWSEFKREFETDLSDFGRSIEALIDGNETEKTDVAVAAEAATKGDDYVKGLREGVKTTDSEGWVEGMGHSAPGESDYVKGQRKGIKTTDSEGWLEGMSATDPATDEYAEGQRTEPKPA